MSCFWDGDEVNKLYDEKITALSDSSSVDGVTESEAWIEVYKAKVHDVDISETVGDEGGSHERYNNGVMDMMTQLEEEVN